MSLTPNVNLAFNKHHLLNFLDIVDLQCCNLLSAFFIQISITHDNIFIIKMCRMHNIPKVDELKYVGKIIKVNLFIRSIVRKVVTMT